MSEFEKLLHHRFICIHKSWLVAINKISTCSNDGIEIGDTELPGRRTYKSEVFVLLEQGLH